MRDETLHYSMIIQWSDEDQRYVVSFPEWGDYAHTHGDSYEEAGRNGQQVLADLVELWHKHGRSLPQPAPFATSA